MVYRHDNIAASELIEGEAAGGFVFDAPFSSLGDAIGRSYTRDNNTHMLL